MKRGWISVQDLLLGRLLAANELPDDLDLSSIPSLPAIKAEGKQLICQRCFNHLAFQPNPCICDGPCFYCLNCLAFAKLRTCDRLYYDLDPHFYFKDLCREQTYLEWPGTLSLQQEQCAKQLLTSYQAGRDHLVWAVTGAGKTEMIFPLVDYALRQGQRIALATPRVDVCNELFPRFQAAFPDIDILLLHGKVDHPYRLSPLTIASTHQLLRFYQAFDLLIVDEVDAFPYHGDPLLEAASRRAVKDTGVRVELTATPSRDQQAAIKQEKVAASILPARYHRHPLPVPKHRWVGDWRQAIAKGRLPGVLGATIKSFLKKGESFLLFLPHIALMEELEKLLHKHFKGLSFTSVSSKDPDRIEKVAAMREKNYQFLLTTTILERGVTFPGIHVIVLGSEDRVFNTSSLVQIAGRVGRKPDQASGQVYFLHEGKTKDSLQAVKQIQWLNQEARKRGLIDEWVLIVSRKLSRKA